MNAERIRELVGDDDATEFSELYEEHGEPYLRFVEHIGSFAAAGYYLDSFEGVFDSNAAFAMDSGLEISGISRDEKAVAYIDPKKLADSLLKYDYFSEKVANGVAVFRNV